MSCLPHFFSPHRLVSQIYGWWCRTFSFMINQVRVNTTCRNIFGLCWKYTCRVSIILFQRWSQISYHIHFLIINSHLYGLFITIVPRVDDDISTKTSGGWFKSPGKVLTKQCRFTMQLQTFNFKYRGLSIVMKCILESSSSNILPLKTKYCTHKTICHC